MRTVETIHERNPPVKISSMLQPRRPASGWSAIVRISVAVSLALVAALLCSVPAHAVTIDWVTVGNPGNPNDTTGYGAVTDSFQIMKEVVARSL